MPEVHITDDTAFVLFQMADRYTFRVAVRDTVDWQTMDVVAEEVTGEVINVSGGFVI